METIEQTNQEPSPIAKYFKELWLACLPRTRKDVYMLILVLAITITCLLVSFNYYTEVKFKYELLQTPCDLCSALYLNNGTYYGIDWNNFTNVLEIKYVNPEYKPTNIFADLNLSKYVNQT
jgi:hypothetical protein